MTGGQRQKDIGAVVPTSQRVSILPLVVLMMRRYSAPASFSPALLFDLGRRKNEGSGTELT